MSDMEAAWRAQNEQNQRDIEELRAQLAAIHDDGAEEALTTHVIEEKLEVNVIPSREFPSYLDFAHCSSVKVSSRRDDDALIEQVLEELEHIDGDRKAQIYGALQERKAARRKKTGWSNSGLRRITSSIGRHKAHCAKSKKLRAQGAHRRGSAKMIEEEKGHRKLTKAILLEYYPPPFDP